VQAFSAAAVLQGYLVIGTKRPPDRTKLNVQKMIFATN